MDVNYHEIPSNITLQSQNKVKEQNSTFIAVWRFTVTAESTTMSIS